MKRLRKGINSILPLSLVKSPKISGIKTVTYSPVSYSFGGISLCFQVYLILYKPLQDAKCSSLVLVDVLMPCVFVFTSLCPRMNLRSCITSKCMYAKVNGCIRCFGGRWLQKWENWVILSHHDRVALDIWLQCWSRVLTLTCRLWAPSVNISAEHPALPDHDSMNNPSRLDVIQMCYECC